MQIQVLGAAAGGAFPQWNCSCSNCRRLRQGHTGLVARSQTQLALSADGTDWYLINASPDLRYQIESFPPLHPGRTESRHSPIAGLILPSAEVDAALGLLLLRESQPLKVYASPSVREILTCDNSLFQVLRRQPDQVQWMELSSGQSLTLDASGIECIPVSTGGGFPGFVSNERSARLNSDEAVLGFFFSHLNYRVAFFPGVLDLNSELLEQFAECDAVFLDGTFWSDDELIRLQGSGKTARQMGHLPVSETIRLLSEVRSRKIFIHINNTNPMLDEGSMEHKQMRDAGWELAFDGMSLSA